MRPSARLVAPLLLTLLTIPTLATTDAAAQHRVRAVRSRPVVVIGAGHYRPFSYRPYFYQPFYWGVYGWHPAAFGPWYAYPPYAYGPFAYPYIYDNAASVRLLATPRAAQVYVNGYFVGTVDDFDGFSQRLRLAPGEYEIELYLDGHRSVRDKHLLRPRASYKLRYTLQPLGPGEPAPSRPEPANPPPSTPGPAAPPEGRYPQAGRPSREPVAESAGFGTLAIRVLPADAVISIDGQRWNGPSGEERLTLQLSAGTHRVEVQREGHRSYSAEVEVRPGELATLNVSLPPR